MLACNCRVQELQLRQSGPGTTAASRVNITRPLGPGVAETERSEISAKNEGSLRLIGKQRMSICPSAFLVEPDSTALLELLHR